MISERPSHVMSSQRDYGPERTVVRSAGGAPAPASDFVYTDCASTANQALTGTPTLDGVATSGKRVLLKNQSTPAQNGVYNVSTAGVWSLMAQARVVCVLNGTTQGQTFFMLTAANTYTAGGAYYK